MRLAAFALLAVAVVCAVVGLAGGGQAPTPISAAPSATTARGEAVFAQYGCGGCHRLAAARAEGPFGPNLDSSLRNVPQAEILRSIVTPNATVAAGWEPTTMPDRFGKRIPPADLRALASWLDRAVD